MSAPGPGGGADRQAARTLAVPEAACSHPLRAARDRRSIRSLPTFSTFGGKPSPAGRRRSPRPPWGRAPVLSAASSRSGHRWDRRNSGTQASTESPAHFAETARSSPRSATSSACVDFNRSSSATRARTSLATCWPAFSTVAGAATLTSLDWLTGGTLTPRKDTRRLIVTAGARSVPAPQGRSRRSSSRPRGQRLR